MSQFQQYLINIVVVRKHALYDFKILEFIETYFIA